MLMRDTIFVLDASPESRAALRKTFEGRFNILEAGTVSQTEVLLRQSHRSVAAIVVDMNVISQHSRQSLRWLLEDPELRKVPHIALLDQDDENNERRAIHLGFTDVIFRPIHSVTSEHRVSNLIEIFRKQWQLENKAQEQEFALRNTNEAIVDTMASLIEGRSLESGQHILRIRKFTKILLEEIAQSSPEYDLTPEKIQAISSAAALHDIGKIAIPDAVLNKPGALTPEEYEVMKTHTTLGAEMLTGMTALGSQEYMRYAYNLCRYHHERWKGEGYPQGLSGNDIPLCAQVVGLADCYDALTTDRVYKKACTHNQAVNMIVNGSCGSFSLALLACFKSVNLQIEEAARKYATGASPRDDAIRAPLAAPVSDAADTLGKLVNKYAALVRYVDATVMDLDLDRQVYHTVYNPNPEFDFMTRANDQQMNMARFASRMVRPNGESGDPGQLKQALEGFLNSGLRQESFSVLLRHRDGTVLPYTLTLLRPAEDQRQVTMLCQRGSMGASGAGDESLRSALVERALPIQPCILDRHLTMPEICGELKNLLGYREEELEEACHGRFMELVPQEQRDGLWDSICRQLRHSSRFTVEIPLKNRDKAPMWILGKGILTQDGGGQEHLNLLFVDITENYLSRAKLRRELEMQELLIAQSDDITFELDFTKDKLICSPKWQERFGYAPISDMILKSLENRSHLHPDDVPLFRQKITELREGTPFVEFTLRIADAQGKYLWSVIRASIQRGEDGEPVRAVGVLMDIGDEVQDAQRREGGADRDHLTGLLNKQVCRRKVERLLEENKKRKLSAMAVIDLDDFKEVNDRYGHLFGDTVLTHVAEEISKLFRDTDVVGRIGGDEFLVFMPELKNHRLAQERFEQLIHAVRQTLAEHMVEGEMSCTVGLAFYPEHGLAYEELFQMADRALYQAKKQGKGCCCVYSAKAEISTAVSMISQRIDSEERIGLQNSNILEYVFARLYQSGDVSQTIQEVMEMVGRELGVSRVYIFENNQENTTCSNTFEWCNEGVEPQIHLLQNINYEEDLAGYRESFNERGVLYAPDISQLPQHLRNILEPQGIKSMLHCAIRENGRFVGYVGLDDNERIRLWTQEQVDVLTTMAQILAVFLLKDRVYTRSKSLIGNLRLLLNQLPGCLYVVDPDTYRLRFFSDSFLKLAPEAKVGDLCYRVFKGQNSPCQNCPLHAEDKKCRIHNDRQDLHLSASAGKILWEGEPAWFVSCHQISTEGEREKV